MSLERILLVDDEPNVLAGYRRGLRGQFDVTTAESGTEALAVLKSQDPFAVVVSDMRMPEMNGVEFLKRVKLIAPDSVRMMLTGNADQETAIQAVNHGHIFRFLNKPCPPQSLSIALAMGVRQYNLVTAEKDLLENTLKGSIEALTEILSLTDPEVFRVVSKVKRYLGMVSEELAISKPWALAVAVMLSPIGMMTLRPELKTKVEKGGAVSPKEEQVLSAVPEIGARLLSHIPRMEEVTVLIRAGVESERAEVASLPLSEDDTLGLNLTRILFTLVRTEDSESNLERAFELLKHKGNFAESDVEKVLNALRKRAPEMFLGEYVVLELPLKKLMVGDELTVDLTSEDDRLLLGKGARMTGPFLERLGNYRKLVGIKEPISVRRFTHKINSSRTPESAVRDRLF